MKPLKQYFKITFTFNKLIHIDLDYYIGTNVIDNFTDSLLWDGFFNDSIKQQSYNDLIEFN